MSGPVLNLHIPLGTYSRGDDMYWKEESSFTTNGKLGKKTAQGYLWGNLDVVQIDNFHVIEYDVVVRLPSKLPHVKRTYLECSSI